MSTRTKLIVTADDYGIGYETSRGIIHAHLQGPVTCTSMMTTTGDHAARSVELLGAAPQLEIGLHLVLSGGDKPLAAGQSSGLLNRDGVFHSLPRLIVAAATGRLSFSGCVDEISAQTDRFHQLLGRPPAYVDGHHHAHQLPTIRDAWLAVMSSGQKLPRISRATVEPNSIRRHVGGARLRRAVARRLGRAGRHFCESNGVATNDWFFGMLDRSSLQQAMPWRHYLENLPAEGTCEWVVHPGCDDETLSGRDSYCTERVQELNSLTNPAYQSLWQRGGIERIVKSTLVALA